ncbi:metallophosphoesterase [uncultured Clostridium sp.]|uniref:metallophosphoesterase n=1 Tax=uncultured Clostridium sp. TaxID=59620 RepID=UPI0026139788|nr:metallophosphoesterase [uncultured Clostridium sp.]
MALYAISDLHLALNVDKPMGIFGPKWERHHEKIKENWIEIVKEEDTVLIAGDISWSMGQEDSKLDLEWIHNLPGRKILIRGNHDYWWTSITKLNALYGDMDFIQNNFYSYGDIAICGTRGWIVEGTQRKFTEHDKKIFEREKIRLRLSLDAAKKKGFEKIIVMIHYPSTSETLKDSDFTEIFKEYNVSKVIYGHLHNANEAWVLNEERDGIEYILTSCDFIDFKPLKILE